MSKFILIKHMEVVNANAVSGFTWGFPAPTHFLGFVNALRLKLNPDLVGKNSSGYEYSNIHLKGCAIFSHSHQIHTYQPYTDDARQYLDDIQFSQKRGTRYMLFQSKRSETPPTIEEAKMNLTVSLLIEYDGYINDETAFSKLIKDYCFTMRLAGGSIFNIADVIPLHLDSEQSVNLLKRQLLPSFVLMDRTEALQNHFKSIKAQDNNKQLYDAWIDFCTFKQASRPKSDLLTKYIKQHATRNNDSELLDIWTNHLSQPYVKGQIPDAICQLFSDTTINDNLKIQLENYINPNEETEIDWEYAPKPIKGYLVPIMCGYRALTPLYENGKITATRDNTTPIRFVESIHSIGEWKSVHRLYELSDVLDCLWQYNHVDGWYLCTQDTSVTSDSTIHNYLETTSPEDELN